VAAVDARAVADVALRLGGARRVKGEAIDPAVGVRLEAKIGDEVREGTPLARIHAASAASAAGVSATLREAFRIADRAEECPPPPPHEVLGG
jgi:thymidine phosphorylase